MFTHCFVVTCKFLLLRVVDKFVVVFVLFQVLALTIERLYNSAFVYKYL